MDTMSKIIYLTYAQIMPCRTKWPKKAHYSKIITNCPTNLILDFLQSGGPKGSEKYIGT